MDNKTLSDQAQIDAYQQILNKYAQELDSTSVPPEVEPEIKPLPPLPPLPADKPEPKKPILIQTPPKVALLPDEPSHPVVVVASGFFKFTALFSFLLFVTLSTMVVYNLYQLQKTKSDIGNFSTLTITQIPIVTETPATCNYNDHTYQVGDTFPSSDNCNTCNCVTNDNIVCTEKACAITPSSKKPTPTPIVTCTFKNKKYKVGQSYKDSCNTCICNADGQAICTTLKCN